MGFSTCQRYVVYYTTCNTFKIYFPVQEPVEIVLGEEIINTESGRNGTIKVKKHSFQYVSIIKVLELLLNQVDI